MADPYDVHTIAEKFDLTEQDPPKVSKAQLMVMLHERLREENLTISDLPDIADIIEFNAVLGELGFHSAVERMSIRKAVKDMPRRPPTVSEGASSVCEPESRRVAGSDDTMPPTASRRSPVGQPLAAGAKAAFWGTPTLASTVESACSEPDLVDSFGEGAPAALDRAPLCPCCATAPAGQGRSLSAVPPSSTPPPESVSEESVCDGYSEAIARMQQRVGRRSAHGHGCAGPLPAQPPRKFSSARSPPAPAPQHRRATVGGSVRIQCTRVSAMNSPSAGRGATVCMSPSRPVVAAFVATARPRSPRVMGALSAVPPALSRAGSPVSAGGVALARAVSPVNVGGVVLVPAVAAQQVRRVAPTGLAAPASQGGAVPATAPGVRHAAPVGSSRVSAIAKVRGMCPAVAIGAPAAAVGGMCAARASAPVAARGRSPPAAPSPVTLRHLVRNGAA